MKRGSLLLLLILVSFTLVACNGSDNEVTPKEELIQCIKTFTKNDTVCDTDDKIQEEIIDDYFVALIDKMAESTYIVDTVAKGTLSHYGSDGLIFHVDLKRSVTDEMTAGDYIYADDIFLTLYKIFEKEFPKVKAQVIVDYQHSDSTNENIIRMKYNSEEGVKYKYANITSTLSLYDMTRDFRQFERIFGREETQYTTRLYFVSETEGNMTLEKLSNNDTVYYVMNLVDPHKGIEEDILTFIKTRMGYSIVKSTN